MSIYFNGVCSDDLYLIVEERPPIVIARRKVEKTPIQGASRDLIEEQDAWENVTVSYKVALDRLQDTPDLIAYERKMSEWLMTPGGYQKLQDIFKPGYFRLASFVGGLDVQDLMGEAGRCTLTFDCDGRRFLDDGDVWEAVDLAEGVSFLNPTPYASRPLISITGHGKFGWRLQNTAAGLDLTYMFNVTGTTNRTIRVEAEKAGDAYRADNGANMNGVTTVTGSGPAGKVPIFPAAGTTVLTPVITETEGVADGVITEMWIMPRWFIV